MIKYCVFKIEISYAYGVAISPIYDNDAMPYLFDTYQDAEKSINDLTHDSTYQIQKLYVKSLETDKF